MNKRSLLILQIAWIAIGVMCVWAAIHNKVTGSGERTLLFALMGLASFVMAYFRHKQIKKG
jgi:cell division protein FtsW (lipid II flippase)